jgi:hypothetical protein
MPRSGRGRGEGTSQYLRDWRRRPRRYARRKSGSRHSACGQARGTLCSRATSYLSPVASSCQPMTHSISAASSTCPFGTRATSRRSAEIDDFSAPEGQCAAGAAADNCCDDAIDVDGEAGVCDLTERGGILQSLGRRQLQGRRRQSRNRPSQVSRSPECFPMLSPLDPTVQGRLASRQVGKRLGAAPSTPRLHPGHSSCTRHATRYPPIFAPNP